MTTGKEGLPGQGLPEAQAGGSMEVTTTHEVIDTLRIEATRGDGGKTVVFEEATDVISGSSETFEGKDVIGNKTKKRKRLLNPETGTPILSTRTETEVRRAIKQENEEAEKAKRLKRESKKAAREEKTRKESLIKQQEKSKGGEINMIGEKQPIDPRFVLAVDARIKPKTRKIGEVLGRVIGQANKNRAAVQDLSDRLEGTDKRSKEALDAAKRAETSASKKNRVPLWVIAAIFGAAALATGAYYFPRDGEIAPAIATATPSEAAGPFTPEAQLNPSEAHVQRLINLDSVYRTQGTIAWLTAAGITDSSIQLTAPQIEEEVVTDSNGQHKIVASGVQVDVQGLSLTWPSVLTTGQSGVTSGRSYQPDPNNPSKLHTDVTGYNGKGTIWVDAQNWSQLAPN